MILLNNCVIEITRKCQLSCLHCLAGGSQNKSISKKVVDKISEVFEINSLCVTGGEVTLNLPMVKYTLNKLDPSYIDITTNGIMSVYKRKKLNNILTKHLNSRKEICLRFSYDDFHFNGCNVEQEELAIRSFNYFNDMTLIPSYQYAVKYEKIIGEGRAFRNQLSMELFQSIPLRYIGMPDIESVDSDCTVYINHEGDVYCCCNLSYISQEKYKKENSPLYYGNIFDVDFESKFDERVREETYKEKHELYFSGWDGEESYVELPICMM